eukprot:Gb_22868 [translate_table: standard]
MEIGAILYPKPLQVIVISPKNKTIQKNLCRNPLGQLNYSYMKYPFLHLSNAKCPSARAVMGDASVSASIEQHEQPLSFYQLLGIPEDGTLLDIKQAYRQLARKYHPDVCPPDQAEEFTRRFIEVQEAYETLSDPRRKHLYDSDLARGIHSRVSAGKRWNCPQEELAKEDWRSRWEGQLSNLKRRSNFKDADLPLSWGARMRQKNCSNN